MAGKRLKKGNNALLAERELDKLPVDEVQPETDDVDEDALPRDADSSIFAALSRSRSRAKPSPERERADASMQVSIKEEAPSVTRSPSFSAREMELISTACRDYLNRLPIYRKSCARDVETLQKILRKCL